MPTLFDSGYGPRPRYQDAAHPYSAFDYYAGMQPPSAGSIAGSAATIGSWPPAGYNPMAGGGVPPFDPVTGVFTDPKPSPTGMELFPGSGNQRAIPLGGGGGTLISGLWNGPSSNGTVSGSGGNLTTPYGGGPLSPSIAGLLQQGLIPDVARQSAEVAGGRGVGGSPAGASTAVRMSEQDYLQRLGLANTLMTGEASRALPYQITPYQSAQMQLARDIALFRAQAPLVTGLPRYGSRSGSGYGGYGGGYGGGGGSLGGGGIQGYNWGGSNPFAGGGYLGGGGGGQSPSLDDIYEQLGFGNFGSQPGDTIGGGYDGSIPGFDYYE